MARVGDMGSPPGDRGGVDLIWSEGAIYNLGVAEALRAWRPLLAPLGTVAFTEPVWLVESPPDEVRAWWEEEYPAITDDRGVRAQVEAAAFRTVDSFPLPASAWWDEYYEPMQSRIERLRTRRPADPIAAEVADAAQTEIDTFRRFSDVYTYGFYIVQPANG